MVQIKSNQSRVQQARVQTAKTTKTVKQATIKQQGADKYEVACGNHKAPKYKDASARAALQKLEQGPKPVSGQAFEKAVVDATKDLDNQAAGSEYKDVKTFVKQNWGQMSPDAKAKWRVYDKHAKRHQAALRTGIPSGDYKRMVSEMKATGYKDAGAGAAIEKLHTQPKPVSGQNMQDAIINATKDLDGQAAGKEYGDLKKYVGQNWNKLSPDAKAKWRVYEREVCHQRAHGRTGIPSGDYKNMIGRMKRAGYQDASAGAAIENLRNQPKPVSGKAMENAIINATKDLDNQAAGKEFADMQKYVGQNWNSLSDQAKAKWNVYAKHAHANKCKGNTGIPMNEYRQMIGEMKRAGNYQDASAGRAIEGLKNSPKPVSGDAMQNAIINATKDLDNQAAGKEYADLKKYATQNWSKLSPDAREKFRTYEKYAQKHQAMGRTGIPMSDYKNMINEMKTAGYEDKGAAKVIEGLKSQKGPISGSQMQNAIFRATRDLDGQAAGAEYRDLKEFAQENWSKMTPDAREKFRTYEQFATSAQARGMSGIPSGEYGQMLQAMNHSGYNDASSANAIEGLKSKSGNISTEDMVNAIGNGTRDRDNQAAFNEYADFANFAYSNWDRLDSGAQNAFLTYQDHALGNLFQGNTGIPGQEYGEMMAELRAMISD